MKSFTDYLQLDEGKLEEVKAYLQDVVTAKKEIERKVALSMNELDFFDSLYTGIKKVQGINKKVDRVRDSFLGDAKPIALVVYKMENDEPDETFIIIDKFNITIGYGVENKPLNYKQLFKIIGDSKSW